MDHHLVSPGTSPNDAFARSQGFKDAATMAAAYKNRMAIIRGKAPTGSVDASKGSLLDQIFAIHPAVLFQHIADKMNGQ